MRKHLVTEVSSNFILMGKTIEYIKVLRNDNYKLIAVSNQSHSYTEKKVNHMWC